MESLWHAGSPSGWHAGSLSGWSSLLECEVWSHVERTTAASARRREALGEQVQYLGGCGGCTGFVGVHALLHGLETLDHLSTGTTKQTFLRMYIPLLTQVAFHIRLPAGLTPAENDQSFCLCRLDAGRKDWSQVEITIPTIQEIYVRIPEATTVKPVQRMLATVKKGRSKFDRPWTR